MSKPLRVLLVEDSEEDALLVEMELVRYGFQTQCLRVDSLDDMQSALQDGSWDVVITDHNMPGFNSDDALKLVLSSELDIPVIIVSGSIGEDIAVAAMKSGAHDYILKNNLTRLAPAIERELRDAEVRVAHRKAQKTIEHMAFHDALTGLANRFEFEQRIRQALDDISRGGKYALLYLDLEQFKVINDTCGHVAGDEMLRQIAVLLKEPIRDTDTLARLGGDEFGVLLSHCSLADAQTVGARMLDLLREFRFTWQAKIFTVGTSIGLVVLERADQAYADVLRQADMACYAAKYKGRNRIHVYHPDDHELRLLHGELEWVNRLPSALQNNEFELHFQRIVPLSSNDNSSTSCEFLVRLREKNGDMVFPSVFIPAAERYNLMPDLDQWIIANCLALWSRAEELGLVSNGGIAFLNLSGATLSDEPFLEFVNDQLRVNCVPAERICFEITETAAIANLSTALNFIRGVKNLGCKVALDDFGAGLSSFSYLKTLPADFVKIDGSFVKDITSDAMDASIVEAINAIAHVAGLQTIAEFVESDDIVTKLRVMGVDYAQGYSIHRPEVLKTV